MLKWAIISAVIAIIAGAMGFGIIAGTAAAIAKIFFFLFLTLFLVLLVATIVIGRKVKAGLSRSSESLPGPRAR